LRNDSDCVKELLRKLSARRTNCRLEIERLHAAYARAHRSYYAFPSQVYSATDLAHVKVGGRQSCLISRIHGGICRFTMADIAFHLNNGIVKRLVASLRPKRTGYAMRSATSAARRVGIRSKQSRTTGSDSSAVVIANLTNCCSARDVIAHRQFHC